MAYNISEGRRPKHGRGGYTPYLITWALACCGLTAHRLYGASAAVGQILGKRTDTFEHLTVDMAIPIVTSGMTLWALPIIGIAAGAYISRQADLNSNSPSPATHASPPSESD